MIYEITVELSDETYEAALSQETCEAERGSAIDVTKVEGDPYEGDYIVTPLARLDQVLATGGKTLDQDMTILQIPYYQTSNPTGDTVYIGSEV